MPRAAKKYQPSPVYVFVTLSLATFLLLFTIWREPGTRYQTAIAFTSAVGKLELSNELLNPAQVLSALRRADLIRGTHPDALAIAEDITDRMNVTVQEESQYRSGLLTLETNHPQAALRLLDAIVQNYADYHGGTGLFASVTSPTTLKVQGGSIEARSLAGMAMLSGAVGLCGMLLSRRAHASTILLTKTEVEKVSRLPVITELTTPSDFPAEDLNQVAKRRLSRVTLRIAELTVAAVFLLMLYQLATRNGLSGRFFRDPLAAYGEVLTAVIG